MKIITIVGARPQFIKASALSRAIEMRSAQVDEILIHTGQHYDHNMSDIFFSEMKIKKPDYFLGIGGCTQGAMTGKMLESIETILMQEKPDWALVYGDTNSTLAGALAAVKLHIPLAHVEAGLRSFNRKMPEEINRILTDQCSDILFTPSSQAKLQLEKEGIPSHKIWECGDIMFDASLHYRNRAQGESKILNTLNLKKKNYFLTTIHRAENCDNQERLTEIVQGLNKIANVLPVIFPLHPRTKQALKNYGLTEFHPNLIFIDPVGYLDMIALESNARLILTDSGGVQKEAYFFHVPCLTLRDETEWVELVDAGFNQLVKAESNSIYEAALQMIEKDINWNISLYGKGNSADIIIETLLKS